MLLYIARNSFECLIDCITILIRMFYHFRAFFYDIIFEIKCEDAVQKRETL